MTPTDREPTRRKPPVRRNARRDNTWSALQSLVMPALVTMIAVLTMTETVLLANAWWDSMVLVGTMVVFEPAVPSSLHGDTSMTVRRADGGTTCMLEPQALHMGGSFLVTRQTSRTVSVHWVGAHTANGAADCGRDVELTMRRDDLDLLTDEARGKLRLHNTAPIGGGFVGGGFGSEWR
jgi:hypothetical protein